MLNSAMPGAPKGMYLPEDFESAAERLPIQQRDDYFERVGILLDSPKYYALLSAYSEAWRMTVE